MRKTVIFAIIVAVMAASGAAFWAWPSGSGKTEILETATVTRGMVRRQLEATGIVQAQVGAIVKIGAQATGRIEKMLVKVADKVKKGDLIAVIDDREIAAGLREAEARLDRARAELERIRSVHPLKVAEARANLAAAQAEDDYAQANLARQERLFQRDLVARDTLDDAAQKARVKENVLTAKKTALKREIADMDKESQKSAKAVAEAEAGLSSARARLSHTRIHSPITGVVSQVTAQEGETVVAGLQVANLITVLDPSRLEMWIYVDETDVGQVVPGLAVEFSVDAYPGRIFKGAINQIYPEPEIRDNIVYYQALVTLDREQARSLRPEMTTQCQIVVQEKQNVLSLPNSALKWVGGEQVVFMPDGKNARRVKPELGLVGLANSEVLSGLSEGDVVATQLVLPNMKSDKKKNR